MGTVGSSFIFEAFLDDVNFETFTRGAPLKSTLFLFYLTGYNNLSPFIRLFHDQPFDQI